MAAIPFALSVHHFVSSVGADAGFAAIIGLAILVLLFFSQARETSTLRRRATESEEHVQQLELRVAQLSRGLAAGTTAAAVTQAPATAAQPRPGVMPAPASVRGAAAAAPTASRAVAASEVPAAPAGVGAPSLSAATRMIPSGDDGAISIRAADPATADREVPAQAAVAGVAAGAAVGMAAAHAVGSDGESGSDVIAPPGPPPATAAGANGSSAGRTAPPPMPAPAPPPAAARSGQQPPRGPARPSGARPSGSGPRRPAPAPHKRSGLATAGMVAAGLLVVAAVVVVLLVVTSGGGGSSSSSSSAVNNASSTTKHHRGTAVKPAAVNVVVLNGTPTPNLAHDITQRLSAVGYQTGAPATATDQNQSATVVGYLPGHKDGALLVAKSLKLGSASVQPVSQSSEAVACPQASTCKAKVVVTVGADLASSATSTSSSTT